MAIVPAEACGAELHFEAEDTLLRLVAYELPEDPLDAEVGRGVLHTPAEDAEAAVEHSYAVVALAGFEGLPVVEQKVLWR